ncbi:MAG TPA: lipoyl(octanoyl) transferase LipB [Opitutaceae bacterium]
MSLVTTLPPLTVLDWGRTAYEPACQLQAGLVERHIAGEIGDTLVFTEHDPVYTIGLRSGADRHLIWDSVRLGAEGITVAMTNRGGDITYHGPGQIVGYPIVNLNRHRDLHAYLRLLEQVMINVVGKIGLAASRREGLTGIWLGERKVAAIGVAVRRWITYHGFALNVNVNLDHFGGIVPCGITAGQGTVTSLQAELGSPLDLAVIKRLLADELGALLPAFLEAGTPADSGRNPGR